MKWRAAGFVSVVLAAIALTAYANRDDRDRVNLGWPDNVGFALVATERIPKGTPGALTASRAMCAVRALPVEEVEVGAITSASYLRGRVSAADISPGQQLTAADFTGG